MWFQLPNVWLTRFPFDILKFQSTGTAVPGFDTPTDTLSLENSIHPSGRVVLKCRQDVAVRVEGQRYLRMVQRFHDDARIDAAKMDRTLGQTRP